MFLFFTFSTKHKVSCFHCGHIGYMKKLLLIQSAMQVASVGHILLSDRNEIMLPMVN